MKIVIERIGDGVVLNIDKASPGDMMASAALLVANACKVSNTTPKSWMEALLAGFERALQDLNDEADK